MLYLTSSFIKDYSSDGFAFEVANLLKTRNIPFNISLNSFIENYAFNGLNNFKHSTRSKKDFQLVIQPASLLKHYQIDRKTILYTVWDTSYLPYEYMCLINECRLVIVPSNETKKVFIASGVDRPIEVIPHGFDRGVFRSRHVNKDYNSFIFGASGQITSYSNDKKDLNKIIKCFLAAFPNNEEVELELKVTKESKLHVDLQDPRIILIQDTYENSNMPNWYNGICCYVNLSKYESFGRQPMEAMACGIPVISPIHSGIADYFDDNIGYSVGYEKVDANCDPYVEGDWYEANEDEVISQMRYVYANETEAFNTGLIASQKIQKFENTNWHEKMLNLIKRYAF